MGKGWVVGFEAYNSICGSMLSVGKTSRALGEETVSSSREPTSGREVEVESRRWDTSALLCHN